MKLLVTSAVLVAASVLANAEPPKSTSGSVLTGDPAPELGGEWLQSNASSLADLRGRVVLIEFWRTW